MHKTHYYRILVKHIRNDKGCAFLLSLLILLTSSTIVYAQSRHLGQTLGMREGLSSGFTVDMAIDGQGFVWVATEAGLNRLAGNTCTTFKTSNSALSGDELVGVCHHAKSQTLWVYDRGGWLDVFDCRRQRFAKPMIDGKAPAHIAAVSQASDGALWLAHYDGDIVHHDPVSGKTWTVPRSHLPKIRKGVRSVADDGMGHLYIGLRMEGLIVYDLRTHRARHYAHRATDASSLPGNNVRHVFTDHLHHVWVGTNGGLALFDPARGTFLTFRHDPRRATSLAGDNIQHISETSRHTLLVASEIGGVSTLDLNTYRQPTASAAFGRLTKEGENLSSNHVRRALEDPYGNLWVAHYGTGVDFLPSHASGFTQLTLADKPLTGVTGLFSDRGGRLWVNQDNWVTVLDGGNVIRRYDIAPHVMNSAALVYIFCEDRDGNIWMGTNDNGVLKLNPKTGQFTALAETRGIDVNALFVDHNGKVWIGTENGVFSSDRGVVRREDAINRLVGADAIPFAFGEDRLGRLWVGTLVNGVTVLSPDKRSGTQLKGLPSTSVNQIVMAANGSMWVATHQGLVCVPHVVRLNDIRVYDARQGLADNNISAVAEGRDGNLWVSHNTGISCFSPKRQRFYNYDFRTGIPMGNFVAASVAMTPDGTLSFGSPGGVCQFRPTSLDDPMRMSPVRIIDCERLKGRTDNLRQLIVEPDDEGVLRLRYNENTFRLAFTVADCSQKGEVEYEYRMKGMDERWYDTEGETTVTFRDLPPGHYTFCVRAKLRNQDWQQATMAEVDVVVDPPLWLTWWAKTAYVGLLLALVAYMFFSYRQRLLLRASLEKERWTSQQRLALNDERLRFFTNITHELRTPLTLIIGPLEDLVGDALLPQAQKDKVSGIHACAMRLLDLVNGILEFRKAETEHRQLTVTRGDLAALVKNLGLRYQDLNRNPQVEVQVKVGEQPVEAYYDTEIITTVVNNFMSNAMKYTPQGRICLSLESDGRQAVVAVSDTGYGIGPQALPHVFDRYYQAGGDHQAPGTGIGLALVKTLAEVHEAQLTVESEEGKGTTFRFALSIDKTYPNAQHEDDETRQAIAEVEQGGKDEQGHGERPLILIVDDNADIRHYVEEALHADYRTATARHGKEGLAMAQQLTPDLIVSDVMMPEMDGMEMTRLLKGNMQTSHIPVVLLTAKVGAADQEEGYDSGADSYLMKPFSARLLRSRVKNILETRRKLAAFVLQQATMPTAAAQPLKSADGAPAAASEANATPADAQPAEVGLSPLDREFMDKVDKLIADNLGLEDLDLAFMTDKMAMSHSTFYRKVKALTGVSANEYVRKVKLRYAMQYLTTGRYNVNEVSMLTGFNSAGYFRKCFRKEFGITPSEVLNPNRSVDRSR